MVLQGRQCTGANTTPLGSLNPAFTGQVRPQEGSLLMPHLANQLQGASPGQQWTPTAPQPAAPQTDKSEEPGSWEPSRMRKKSRSKSRDRGSRRRRSRSRSGSRRRKRRSRSRSRRSRSKGRSRRHRSRSRSRERRRKSKTPPEKAAPVIPVVTEEPKAEKQKKRRSRWGAQDDLEFIPGMPVTLPPNLTEEQQRLYLIHVKIEEINKKLKSGNLDADDTRSPSPEPIYNSEGKRLNTREFRIRKRLEDERQALIQEAMRLNPNFRPAGGEVQQTRHQEKVMIPVLQNPNVNFMGLLIGPRGNSLKKLEEETGTKIMIRGKGSVKEGKGRKDGQPMPGEDEDLHALISAPTEEGLHRAIKRITQIINDAIVAPDNTNELKKLQMRELALLNGTLRDEDLLKCSNCGALDHRDWECQGDRNVTQMVSCTRCGGGGHLASDCRVDLSQLGNQNTLPDKAKMDSEYMSLMAELGVAEDGVGLGGTTKQPQAQSGFNPQQANVIGGGVRPKHPGLGSDFAPKNNHNNNNNNNNNNNRGGFNHRGGMVPRGPVRSERPPWQQRGPPPGHDGGRGGFRPYPRFNSRGPHPSGMRGPAPWQQDPYGGHRPPYQPRNAPPSHSPSRGSSRGMSHGSFGGYMPPHGVNIPASKPPPPPEEPPEQPSEASDTSSSSWDQGGMPGWGMSGMMPPVMPPWMSGPQMPPVPPAPPSQPPPPSS